MGPAAANAASASNAKPPVDLRKQNGAGGWSGAFSEFKNNLANVFGAHDSRSDHKFVPHDHGSQRKVPGGEHHQVGPLIPGHTVDHAKRYGHFTRKQLGEIEKELTKYADTHHAEILSMRKFRKTLPIDPHMWSPTDKKRFDMRYKANVNKVKQLAKDSRAVSAKWKIPPKNVGGREKTYVLDEKHLAQISDHLQLLSEKGEWNDEQRQHFERDLNKYVELETVVLGQVRADKAAARSAVQTSGTKPPTAKGEKKGPLPLTPEMKEARKLRGQLENAVVKFRHEL